jgi:hypothetical protein
MRVVLCAHTHLFINIQEAALSNTSLIDAHFLAWYHYPGEFSTLVARVLKPKFFALN